MIGGFLVGCVLALAWPASAGNAADGFDALPGADRYRLVQARLRQIGRGGTVGEVRFDEETDRIFFRQGDA